MNTDYEEIIYEYFQYVFHHVRKDGHHTLSEGGRSIKQPNQHSFESKYFVRTSESRFLLILSWNR